VSLAASHVLVYGSGLVAFEVAIQIVPRDEDAADTAPRSSALFVREGLDPPTAIRSDCSIHGIGGQIELTWPRYDALGHERFGKPRRIAESLEHSGVWGEDHSGCINLALGALNELHPKTVPR
jgi:hypothetical protein